jgi:hypothetical protein
VSERYTVAIVYWAMWMLLGWGTYAVVRWRRRRRVTWNPDAPLLKCDAEVLPEPPDEKP